MERVESQQRGLERELRRRRPDQKSQVSIKLFVLLCVCVSVVSIHHGYITVKYVLNECWNDESRSLLVSLSPTIMVIALVFANVKICCVSCFICLFFCIFGFWTNDLPKQTIRRITELFMNMWCRLYSLSSLLLLIDHHKIFSSCKLSELQ